jgi:hypothetical protein
MAVDYALDLAVIKIDAVTPRFVRRAKHEPKLLERIRILGFAGTGGETLTATMGTVSGFTSEQQIVGSAWIKTDAAVTGGSSGSMAVNDDGELVGIVVELGSGSDEADVVDCRAGLADTNGDDMWDEADGCVPVGGFINALRPVQLADGLITSATQRTPYKPVLPRPAPTESGYDASKVAFTSFVFSDERGVARQSFATTAKAICASWDYHGMDDGMRWASVWWIDGYRYDEVSHSLRRWREGPSGRAEVCIEDAAGLPDGLYELNLSVEGSFITSSTVRVGSD